LKKHGFAQGVLLYGRKSFPWEEQKPSPPNTSLIMERGKKGRKKGGLGGKKRKVLPRKEKKLNFRGKSREKCPKQ